MKSEYKIPTSVLFVCTGNSDRSPMAEYLLKAIAEERGLEIEVASRGTMASRKSSFTLEPSEKACTVVRELYPNSLIFIHETAPVKLADMVDYDLVLTMEEKHRDRILEASGYFKDDNPLEGRVFALKEYVGIEGESLLDRLDVEDPIGSKKSNSSYTKVTQSTSKKEPKGKKENSNETKKSKGKPTVKFNPSTGKKTVIESNGSKTTTTSTTDYAEKSLAIYRETRDEILYCINQVLDGNVLPLKEIYARREQRTEAIKIQKEIEDAEKEKERKAREKKWAAEKKEREKKKGSKKKKTKGKGNQQPTSTTGMFLSPEIAKKLADGEIDSGCWDDIVDADCEPADDREEDPPAFV